MADRLYTSQKADEIFRSLRLETKIDLFILARMAFAVSLVKQGKTVEQSTNFSGGEMKRPTFIGSDEVFYRTLIAKVYEQSDLDEELFYSNKSVIKNHIDSGSGILWSLYQEQGQDHNKWLTSLMEMIEMEGKEVRGKDLDIFIGRRVLNNDEVLVELNNTAKHANSHLAIMGKPGVGKTQFLLKILADIRQQSDYQTNFIYFDYKGDVVDNERFIDVAKARTYKLLQNNEFLPINPFVLPNYDDQSIIVSAREKAESFASISSKLGVVQKGTLSEAIRSAYTARALTGEMFPDFRDVYEMVRTMYENDNRSDDTLVEVLRDLADFNLFWSHGSAVKPFEKVSNRTFVVDVHHMPVLKELVAYLVIERLYKEMVALPDSSVKDGRRTLRTILVIDEAHNYLSQKNIFLQKIIREGRSKGVVVFFASQSPNDYQQKEFNFQELLEFAYIFQCEGVSASSLQDILGCSQKTARDLQTEVAHLEPFQVIARSPIKSEDFLKFTGEAFYKSY